jgi:predicted  nucleic acid-binding Zn-ribbon protein
VGHRNGALEQSNANLMMRIETDNANISSLEQSKHALEHSNASLKVRIETDNASISSLKQRKEELEQTNVDLMMRIQALETQASAAEKDAYDAVQDNARMMEIAQHLQEDNNDLKSRISSLEADNAGISSSEHIRQELERTNANLIMRMQALEAQANHEQDAYMQMRQIATQLQKENADFKQKVGTLETTEQTNADLIMRIQALETQASAENDAYDADQRRQELEQTNADLMMRIQALETQASMEHDAYDEMQRKVMGFEQDTKEALDKAQQAHALQELLFARNKELQEQVQLAYLRDKGIKSDEAMQDKTQLYADSPSNEAMQDKKQLYAELALGMGNSEGALSAHEFKMKLNSYLQSMGSAESVASSLAGDITPQSRATNNGRVSSVVSPPRRLVPAPAGRASNVVSPSRVTSNSRVSNVVLLAKLPSSPNLNGNNSVSAKIGQRGDESRPRLVVDN